LPQVVDAVVDTVICADVVVWLAWVIVTPLVASTKLWPSARMRTSSVLVPGLLWMLVRSA